MFPRLLQNPETLAMKNILLVLCLFCTATAFAQYNNNVGGNSINNQAQVYQFESHTGHAAYAPMSEERNILPRPLICLPGKQAGIGFCPTGRSFPRRRRPRTQKTARRRGEKSSVVWVNN